MKQKQGSVAIVWLKKLAPTSTNYKYLVGTAVDS